MSHPSANIDHQIAKIKKSFAAGNKEQAIAECKGLVLLYPNNFSLHKLLGNLLAFTGQFLTAAKELEKGFALNPQDEELLFNLAVTYRQGLAFQDAIRYLSIYTEKYSTSPDGWGSLSECLFQTGDFHRALTCGNQALSLNKNDHRVYFNRAKIYRSLKKLDFAYQDAQTAMELAPNNLSYMMEFAELALLNKGRDFAQPYFQKVIVLQPTSYIDVLNLGRAFYELGDIPRSITIFKQLIQANQLLELSYLYLGSAHFSVRDFAESIRCFHQVLQQNPHSLDANLNLAITFQAVNRMVESTPFIEKALEINPSSALAYKLRAESLAAVGQDEDALVDLLRAEEFDAHLESLQSLLLYQKLNLCDWSHLEDRKNSLISSIQLGQADVVPFQATLFFDLPDLHQLCARRFIAKSFPLERYPAPTFTKSDSKKLKIAYLSPDFGKHPVSYLSAELFELHDRQQFEIIGVSLSYRESDPYRERIQSSVDTWLDISQLDDQQAIDLLRSHHFDIAIDLCGHTRHSRFVLFASRIAPIQISYLGYLGTMGCPEFIDYLIADKTIIPSALRSFYDEKIIYLPCYQINDRKRSRPSTEINKTSFGVPNDHFLFACLNNSFKYHPEVFAVWMRILQATPNSSLLLQAKYASNITNLKSEAVKFHINPDRLVFLDNTDQITYLSRLKTVDLFLDTPIYNAGTTASDALWMGVPVLTCAGKSFSARVAASVLVACGLETLVVDTLSHYEKIAIEIANDEHKHQQIKQHLQALSSTCKLFDSLETTRSLEKAFHVIFERYSQRHSHQDVEIE